MIRAEVIENIQFKTKTIIYKRQNLELPLYRKDDNYKDGTKKQKRKAKKYFSTPYLIFNQRLKST